MVAAADEGTSALLIAPTGGGKTLAGFLPSLIELAERPRDGLHTLYISPLKALAVDIQRNLESPIAEMRLPIRAETRTGDTPEAKRRRQRAHPPHILMTTPESLALLLSYSDSDRLFHPLRCVIVDELHALAGTKRGDLLALALARLGRLAPAARRVGLSATVAAPDQLLAWLSRSGRTDGGDVKLVLGRSGARPDIAILDSRERLPWAGHTAQHAMAELYQRNPPAAHDAGLRQHPRAGRNGLSGAVEGQRRHPAHRPASRIAGGGAAAQGGGGDGAGDPGGGRHLLPRSRH